MYVQKCGSVYRKPPLALITQVGTVPDQKTQYKITFSDIGVVDMSHIKALLDRVPAALEICQKVYEFTEPTAAADNGKEKKF
jgi:hypothetical protein